MSKRPSDVEQIRFVSLNSVWQFHASCSVKFIYIMNE